MSEILLDTSVIVGLLDRSDRHHQECVEAIEDIRQPLITCEAVIAEACYLLRKLPGAAEVVLENIRAGMIRLPWSLSGHEEKIARLLAQYAKLPMDLADACLVCMADDFKTAEILTLDSDFEVYRWASRKPFRLLISRSGRSKG